LCVYIGGFIVGFFVIIYYKTEVFLRFFGGSCGFLEKNRQKISKNHIKISSINKEKLDDLWKRK